MACGLAIYHASEFQQYYQTFNLLEFHIHEKFNVHPNSDRRVRRPNGMEEVEERKNVLKNSKCFAGDGGPGRSLHGLDVCCPEL